MPKQLLQERRLCDGDEPCWVECHSIESNQSTGWLSTKKSLDAQGYNQGQRELWLPKPTFTAYRVQPKASNSRKIHQHKQQEIGRRPRRKHDQAKPRRDAQDNASTRQPHKSTKTVVERWIPRESLAQAGKVHNSPLVSIKATGKGTKDSREWIVPQALLTEQGYYEGDTKLWLPKALVQRPSRSEYHHITT